MTRFAKSHTHTQITVMIYTSEQGYNAAISSWQDMQNHTHTLILLACRRSCSQVVDLAAHGNWISSIYVYGSENWFLACNETTKLPSLTCTFGLQEHSASGRRKHRKNNDQWTQDEGLFILKQWSLDTGWNYSSWCQEVLGYLPRARLRRRSMFPAAVLEGWAT
jgi:hypothetical protein